MWIPFNRLQWLFCPMVINHLITSNSVNPGPNIIDLGLWVSAGQIFPCIQKNLRGQIFRFVVIIYSKKNVAVNLMEVQLIELAKCMAVASGCQGQQFGKFQLRIHQMSILYVEEHWFSLHM